MNIMTASTESTSKLQEIQWSPPLPEKLPQGQPNGPSQSALLALQFAYAAAKEFDSTFTMRNPDRERSVSLFHADEIVIKDATNPIRTTGYYAEFAVEAIQIMVDVCDAGSCAEETRSRVADRVNDTPHQYSIKYLQAGLVDTDHGPTAAADMVMEAKILMNLSPHPNVCQIYGVNSEGIDAFLSASSRKSFFILTDRLSESLVERLDAWRENRGYYDDSNGTDNLEQSRLTERLEVALDICSALVYLHDRHIVFNVRPDKVGFDMRCKRIKLCNFGQSRHEGVPEHSRSLTKSDDVVRTLAYTAPEVLCKAPATLSSDVYAYGILLWEILTLQRPFIGYDRAQHFSRVVVNHERPSLSGLNKPKDVVELLPKCWNPHFRPTMNTVLEQIEASLLFQDDELEQISSTNQAFRGCLARTASKSNFAPEQQVSSRRLTTKEGNASSSSLNLGNSSCSSEFYHKASTSCSSMGLPSRDFMSQADASSSSLGFGSGTESSLQPSAKRKVTRTRSGTARNSSSVRRRSVSNTRSVSSETTRQRSRSRSGNHQRSRSKDSDDKQERRIRSRSGSSHQKTSSRRSTGDAEHPIARPRRSSSAESDHRKRPVDGIEHHRRASSGNDSAVSSSDRVNRRGSGSVGPPRRGSGDGSRNSGSSRRGSGDGGVSRRGSGDGGVSRRGSGDTATSRRSGEGSGGGVAGGTIRRACMRKSSMDTACAVAPPALSDDVPPRPAEREPTLRVKRMTSGGIRGLSDALSQLNDRGESDDDTGPTVPSSTTNSDPAQVTAMAAVAETAVSPRRRGSRDGFGWSPGSPDGHSSPSLGSPVKSPDSNCHSTVATARSSGTYGPTGTRRRFSHSSVAANSHAPGARKPARHSSYKGIAAKIEGDNHHTFMNPPMTPGGFTHATAPTNVIANNHDAAPAPSSVGAGHSTRGKVSRSFSFEESPMATNRMRSSSLNRQSTAAAVRRAKQGGNAVDIIGLLNLNGGETDEGRTNACDAAFAQESMFVASSNEKQCQPEQEKQNNAARRMNHFGGSFRIVKPMTAPVTPGSTPRFQMVRAISAREIVSRQAAWPKTDEDDNEADEEDPEHLRSMRAEGSPSTLLASKIKNDSLRGMTGNKILRVKIRNKRPPAN